MDERVQKQQENQKNNPIERLRERLLDLSSRNKLLNFSHRSNHIRVIDELPNQLYELLTQGDELSFLPVPQPTKELLIKHGYLTIDPITGEETNAGSPTAIEWAKKLGYDIEYELPVPSSEIPQKHQDTRIQTQFFPEALEARLRDIYNKAKTFEEGTGTNILYLVFGFLEWYESSDSNKPRLAPLHLVPVRINKGRLDKSTNTFSYTINFTDEDILPNLSLREKLKNDFGLNLPDLNEETKPENYFSEINKLIKKTQPHWKIHRYCTLGLLHFGKLLLYLDLDSKKWPKNKNILDHTIVCNLLGTQKDEKAENDIFTEEYEIDEIKDVHYQYPLMDDADSSQHSVLIDALNNVNLVVEGPPGTGKSQTIANLIAAAIAQGKKILFVTEKLVALEVVKRRLDKAGLGDFCLELHSHKTQKSKILQDLSSRMENQNTYKNPGDIEEEIKLYEKHKNELKEYAKIINEIWLNTSKSIHHILTGLVRYRNELKDFDLTRLKANKINGENLNLESQRNLEELIYEYKELYLKIISKKESKTNFGLHPWHGVNNIEIQLYDVNQVCDSIKELQASIKNVEVVMEKLESKISPFKKMKEKFSLIYIEELITDLNKLPSIKSDDFINPIPILKGDLLKEFGNYLDLHSQIQNLHEKLSPVTNADALKKPLPTSSKITTILKNAKKFPTENSIRINDLKEKIDISEEVLEKINKISPIISLVCKKIGGNSSKAFNISEAGLNELLTFIDIASHLDASLWDKRHPCLETYEIDSVITPLHLKINSVKEKESELKRYFELSKLPKYCDIEFIRTKLSTIWIFGVFNKDWKRSRKALRQLAKNPKEKFSVLHNHLSALLDYAQECEELENHAKNKKSLGSLYNGVNTDTVSLIKLRNWYKKIKESYELSIANNNPFLKHLILSISPEIATDIQSLKNNGTYDCLKSIINNVSKIKSIFVESKIKKQDFIVSNNESSFLSRWHDTHQELLHCFDLHFKNNSTNYLDATEMLQILENLSAKLEIFNLKDINKFIPNGNITLCFGSTSNDKENKYAEKIYAISASIQNINNEDIKNFIYSQPNIELLISLKNYASHLTEALQNFNICFRSFENLTNLNKDDWLSGNTDSLENIYLRNDFAIINANELIHWLDYLRVQKQLCEYGFTSLVDHIENDSLPIEKILPLYYFMIFDMLSREIYSEHKDLKRYFPRNLEVLRSLFQNCDNKIKKLQRQFIAARAARNNVPLGSTGSRADDYTDQYLLQRECGKKKRHIPLRKLILKAKDAILALKPCFMMGPLAVAQYLPPGLIEFDLVIMDEASQIKPEDALGSIARAKQAIIIGDPKQLPPTNFFDSLTDDDGSEEESILTDSESILDAALPIFRKRRLRWHYRSQHESLIAFSNHNFYDRDLIIFPSPYHTSDLYGVKNTYIENARFINNSNQEEATAIAEAVKNHLLYFPNESLGIVAMNIHQTDLIDKLIEQLRKDDPLLQQAYEMSLSSDEPIFIKNLENVQGDERDVILISTTYGPCEYGGKTFQRFGPINAAAGWRRLNVLFTRSKKRMHVFTSMRPEDVVPTDTSSRGLHALKNFLSYAKNGIIDQPKVTGKEPDSDFEIAVATALQQAGFEADYQVGVAGFYIDIAVKHPLKAGFYLMGIECDGAAYHSAKSARDRDRLRQEILEMKGWNIRRVWSTDWFKDYKSVLAPIIQELHRLSSAQEVV